ncbi:fungal-specific transcription factor domain-containing protein [Lasiosphaeria ovina]|uniref:Fungal-specific transcription factor domain-containing protein n=1 Tax=Lasiosphaeria ovina TaxID=92902 RepID=A0AAE0KAE1_9PEZI|nr:fungal-specific transcription factor domain-containing protein [Lasiosphaeria ovina]
MHFQPSPPAEEGCHQRQQEPMPQSRPETPKSTRDSDSPQSHSHSHSHTRVNTPHLPPPPPPPPPPLPLPLSLSPPSDPEFGAQGACFGKLHFAGYHLGEISSYNGIPLFSPECQALICARTGKQASFPAQLGDPWSWEAHDRAHLSLDARSKSIQPPPIDLSLPDRSVTEGFVAFFKTSHLRLVFPFINFSLFQHTIDVAYTPWNGWAPSSPEPVAAKACVFAFLAIMSLLGCPMKESIDGDEFALKAHQLQPVLLQQFSMTGLQTALMLSTHQLFSGQVQSSTMLHSLACRIVFFLGGHLLADPWSTPLASQTKRHLRQLFWLCYSLDKEISLRTGQPPSIDDNHCDLTLPAGYLAVQYLDKDKYADSAPWEETAVPILPGDLRLAFIKSKTCTLLYSAQSLRKSDAELLKDIRELDDELERWRLSVPRNHRPLLSVSPDAAADQFTECSADGVRTLVVNFEYHYLMATIHRATGRCRAWGDNGHVAGGVAELEEQGVSSSLTLSIEASRSTLLFLRSVPHALLEESTSMLAFYPMSAVVTLFFSILLDPLNPRSAQADLGLLASAPELIKGIRRRLLTRNEMLHIQMVDEFIAELTHLAHCAVRMAGERDVHGGA